jgi:hypothetical protein
MSDADSTSSTDPYDTGPGSTLEEIKADLDNSKDTTIADINGLFEWLSLRKGGGRAAKISKLLAIYNDGFPNVLRLARDYYHKENHRDASLLENITTDNRRTANFNEDGLQLHDFLYDESTGRFSVTADGASRPEPEDAAGGSIVLSAADFAALQARVAAVESVGGGGGGGLDEHHVLALIDKSKKEARAELLTDIREGREVVDTWASNDDRRQATAYELGDDFAIFDFERAPRRADTANLYDNANPETSFVSWFSSALFAMTTKRRSCGGRHYLRFGRILRPLILQIDTSLLKRNSSATKNCEICKKRCFQLFRLRPSVWTFRAVLMLSASFCATISMLTMVGIWFHGWTPFNKSSMMSYLVSAMISWRRRNFAYHQKYRPASSICICVLDQELVSYTMRYILHF